MEVVLKGIFIGLSMVVFLGPVFFTLLKTTFSKGKKHGFAVALGIFASDIMVVLICLIGAKLLPDDFFENKYFVILSFLILLGFGLNYLFFTDVSKVDKVNFKNESLIKHFFLGFSINFLNPFVFGVWLGVIAYTKSIPLSLNETVYFFMAALLAILSTDGLKVILADIIKPYLQKEKLAILYKGMGIILILFSLRIIYIIF